MPTYEMKCPDGHTTDINMRFSEFDKMKADEPGYTVHCAAPHPTLFHIGGVCGGVLAPVTQATPFVFAINDGDFAISKKVFGIGRNVKEI